MVEKGKIYYNVIDDKFKLLQVLSSPYKDVETRSKEAEEVEVVEVKEMKEVFGDTVNIAKKEYYSNFDEKNQGIKRFYDVNTLDSTMQRSIVSEMFDLVSVKKVLPQ